MGLYLSQGYLFENKHNRLNQNLNLVSLSVFIFVTLPIHPTVYKKFTMCVSYNYFLKIIYSHCFKVMVKNTVFKNCKFFVNLERYYHNWLYSILLYSVSLLNVYQAFPSFVSHWHKWEWKHGMRKMLTNQWKTEKPELMFTFWHGWEIYNNGNKTNKSWPITQKLSEGPRHVFTAKLVTILIIKLILMKQICKGDIL